MNAEQRKDFSTMRSLFRPTPSIDIPEYPGQTNIIDIIVLIQTFYVAQELYQQLSLIDVGYPKSVAVEKIQRKLKIYIVNFNEKFYYYLHDLVMFANLYHPIYLAQVHKSILRRIPIYKELAPGKFSGQKAEDNLRTSKVAADVSYVTKYNPMDLLDKISELAPYYDKSYIVDPRKKKENVLTKLSSVTLKLMKMKANKIVFIDTIINLHHRNGFILEYSVPFMLQDKNMREIKDNILKLMTKTEKEEYKIGLYGKTETQKLWVSLLKRYFGSYFSKYPESGIYLSGTLMPQILENYLDKKVDNAFNIDKDMGILQDLYEICTGTYKFLDMINKRIKSLSNITESRTVNEFYYDPIVWGNKKLGRSIMLND